MSDILCGPMLRYVDRRSAVVFVELAEDAEIELGFAALRDGVPIGELTTRAWPVRIGDAWYAWIKCAPLLPDTWYGYRIGLRDPGDAWREVWPDRSLTGLSYPSQFRTLPMFSVTGTRIAFGSCRAGFPPTDGKAIEEGIDALHAYADEIVANFDRPDDVWPHFFLFLGDQIYGDNISFEKRREFARRPENPVKSNHATTFAEYAALYREAWTTVGRTRWMLSCIPSFMIFDDHEITDDWNITEQWLRESLRSPGWTRLMRDGLLAYWVYQGAGNLSPRQARTDERSRWLLPRHASPFRDVTRRIEGLFDSYIRRRRAADWGYTVDVPDARFVVADTRMSRRLTGKRLLMNDTTWNTFSARALDARARKTFLVVPAPYLVGHPMHDLLSRVAESIEGNPPSVIGAIGGGLVGTLIAGPAGGLVGAIAGSVGAEYLLDKYGEDIVRTADIELWPAFPTSFNRMLTLLEKLHDGIGTPPRRFVGLLAGDVHHSNVFRGDFLRTARAGSVMNFTMSPLQRHVSDDDQSLLRDLEGGTWYIDAANSLERPGFVDDQRRRMNWYPLDMNGDPADRDDDDSWNLFGKFIGELFIDAYSVSYRYQQAQRTDGRLRLNELTRRKILAI
jgi:hypothetical protein